ncbi:MAG: nitrilase-related carbon-nitrogen hydrolase [Candidatus Rhabdochlamydia sp.]
MIEEFKVACVQLNSNENVEANLKIAGEFIHAACDAGAHFILTPEYTPYFPNPQQSILKQTISGWQPRILEYFCHLASRRHIWLNIGMVVLDEPGSSLLNRVYLINTLGKIVSTYDKIHLFDSYLTEQEVHVESKIYKAGQNIVVEKIPWGNLTKNAHSLELTCKDITLRLSRCLAHWRVPRKEKAFYFFSKFSQEPTFTNAPSASHYNKTSAIFT